MLTLAEKDSNPYDNTSRVVLAVAQFFGHNATKPARNALGAPRNSDITINFSQPIKTNTLNAETFVVQSVREAAIPGTFSILNPTQALFNPANDFLPGDQIQVTLTAGIESQAGGVLRPFVFNFTVTNSGCVASRFLEGGQDLDTEYIGFELGDVDGDGDLDAIGWDESQGFCHLWKNNGFGVFTKMAQSFGNLKNIPPRLLDWDGDGDLDLVNGKGFWWNNGVGVFTNSIPSGSDLGFNGGPIEVGDFDADGRIDLMVFDNSVTVLMKNNGGGTFTNIVQTTLGAGGYNTEFSVGDVTGDGMQDLVYYGGQIATNDRTGRFWMKTVGVGASGEAGVELGDLDGDGDLDAFMAGSSSYDEHHRVMLNNGSGTFSNRQNIVAEGHPRNVRLADVDADGDVDAILMPQRHDNVDPLDCVSRLCDRPAQVFLNTGAAQFVRSEQDLGYAPYNTTDFLHPQLAVGDLDGDGDLDALIANASGQVRLNVGCNDPDIEIRKSASDLTPVPGQLFSFFVVVSNRGNAVATNLQVRDWVVTDDAAYLSSSSGHYDQPTGIWYINRVLPSSSTTLVIQVEAGISSGGVVHENVAELTATGATDSQLSNHTDSVEVRIGHALITSTSPLHHEGHVESGSPVVLGVDKTIQLASVNQGNFFVTGKQFGRYPGTIEMPTSTQLVFSPSMDYLAGDEVTVVLRRGITTGNGGELGPARFNFTVKTDGCGGIQFSTNWTSLSGPTQGLAFGHARVADLDQDGNLDVWPHDDLVFFGNGMGGFPATAQFPTSGLGVVVVEDLNRDGLLDASGGHPPQVFTNNGSRQLVRKAGPTIAIASFLLDAGDFNGDGIPDLAFANAESGWQGAFRLFTNNGMGAFAEIPEVGTYHLNPEPGAFWPDVIDMKLADVSGDGLLDLVSVNANEAMHNRNRIFINHGTGFDRSRSDLGSNNFFTVELGDVDGDRDLDAAVLGWTPRIYNNNGSGRFTNILQTFPMALYKGRLADLNGDGRKDFVAVNPSGNCVYFFLNQTNHQFSLVHSQSHNNAAAGLEVGDFDKDGDLDLALGSGEKIRFLVNGNCADIASKARAYPPVLTNDNSMTYTITVTNKSAVRARQVQVSTTLPPFLEPGGVVTSSVGDIDPWGSSEAVVPLTVGSNYVGDIVITSLVSMLAVDTNLADNCAAATNEVSEADFDVDLMPDVYDPDDDNDGYGDISEMLADTDPFNADSMLQMIVAGAGPGVLSIQWQGGESVTQYIEATYSLLDNPITWEVLHTNAPPTSVTNTLLVPDEQGYTTTVFRIRAGP